MMFSFQRVTLALALTLGLALVACGGKAKFDIGGPISGLDFDGLKLTNTTTGEVITIPAKATSFKFGQSIDYGSTYNVVLTANPAHQDCAVFNGADTAGRMAAINIGVQCLLLANTVGGKINGTLSSAGLVLTNGSNEQLAIAANATKYEFFNKSAYGTAYGVTILSQPTDTKNTCTDIDLTCTVAL